MSQNKPKDYISVFKGINLSLFGIPEEKPIGNDNSVGNLSDHALVKKQILSNFFTDKK